MRLTNDIDEIQDRLLKRPPTTKELSNFSTKLEVRLYLNMNLNLAIG